MTRLVVDRESKDSVLRTPRKLGVSLGTGPDLDGVLQVRQPAGGTAVETAVRACPTGALQLVD